MTAKVFGPDDALVLDISNLPSGSSTLEYCAPCDSKFRLSAEGAGDSILELRLDGRLASSLDLLDTTQTVWFTTCSHGSGGTSMPACAMVEEFAAMEGSSGRSSPAWELPLLASYEEEVVAFSVEGRSPSAVISPRSGTYFPVIWATLEQGQRFHILSSTGRGNFRANLNPCSGLVQTGLDGDNFGFSRRLRNRGRGDVTILVGESIGDRCSNRVYQVLLLNSDGTCAVLPPVESSDYSAL